MTRYFSLCITLTFFLLSCKQESPAAPDYPPYPEMTRVGDSLFEKGDFSGAIMEYRKVIKAYPDSVQANQVLTRAYMGVGLFDDAKVLLDKVEFGADTVSTLSKYRRYAMWSIFKGDTASLRRYNDSLLRYAFHTYPRPYRDAAFNEVFLKDFKSAMDHLKRFTVYGTPEHTPVNMGFLLLREGDSSGGMEILNKAEKRITKTLLTNPTDADALFELAEVYVMKRDTAAAMEYLKLAFQTGLASDWWVYHLLSEESLPDPVFAPLQEHPGFQKLKDSVLRERMKMKHEVLEVGSR